ncbi:hypothetical protein [Burkholderia sp. Ac-20365]|uniref:hypothetical protein n=1 Tax=Burkholderia sp. Ac-20365 TaxID=2703897 RepID=UPI00197B8879|nr:hypothetical protein [Burkholderia sp. Ac-20365]MBN3761376.1 hypothetical protein [Burkholderia sp. Ac-20365]
MDKKNASVSQVKTEIASLLQGHVSASGSADKGLSDHNVWKARAAVVQAARRAGVVTQLSAEALEAVIGGAIDGAQTYADTLVRAGHVVAPERSAETAVSETPLFSWEHVPEATRPQDTGKRTSRGHRIIHSAAAGGEFIEFPFNSGVLVPPGTYASNVSMALQSNAADLLKLAKEWVSFAKVAGLPVPSSLLEKTVGTIARAEGTTATTI